MILLAVLRPLAAVSPPGCDGTVRCILMTGAWMAWEGTPCCVCIGARIWLGFDFNA